MPATERAREELERQVTAAAQRYHDTSAQRHAIEEQLDAGVKFPDSPEAITARAERLLDRGGVPPAAAVAGIRAEALDVPDTRERIIGISKDLQAWSFLPRGARAASTIARISIRHNGRELPHGTGFLVSPRLLMTNHHVLPDEAFAQRCFLEFNAQVTIENTPDAAIRLELDPGTFFSADERLDYALVAVTPGADGRLPGDVFGWNRLSIQLGKLVVGEPVNVIGHPSGRLKEIALRDNALQVRLDDFLHYKTDTEPGNSGSPVFNDQWEVVALHHSGVPKTDAQGRVLRKDGQIWRRADGDDAIDYVLNEGARTSSILKHLAALDLGPARRALLAEMGPDSGLQQDIIPGPEEAPPAVVSSMREAVARKGLRVASNAFGKRRLVFLHGRRQQGLDPEVLRRGWTGGLNHGLTRAGIASIDPADVWFPYYGDRLNEAVGHREAIPGSFEEVTAASAAEAFAAESTTGAYEQLIVEAAVRAGMPQDGQVATEGLGSTLVGAVQRALSWLAAKTDVDALAIATIFRDVDMYLSDPKVRKDVLDCVVETLPPDGELVLVTHSLGTVVGMDLIANRLPDGMDVSLLVTAGSPLGMDTVYSRLLVPGPKRPEKVRHWVNAWCPTDAVAIGCPLENAWGKLTDLAVANARDRAHNIEEYLAHPDVAAAIGGAIS
ncbi:serine protease [Streptomyces sp. NPDC002994]|uniref:trypsin-like serine peptidase n=1 Tax=Streptomyces sp. NPDC002994 TaxID=3154441 RepID=UPI0033B90FE1